MFVMYCVKLKCYIVNNVGVFSRYIIILFEMVINTSRFHYNIYDNIKKILVVETMRPEELTA